MGFVVVCRKNEWSRDDSVAGIEAYSQCRSFFPNVCIQVSIVSGCSEQMLSVACLLLFKPSESSSFTLF